MSVTARTRWCLLIHALPARPLYLRARIRRLLAQLGAAPLKKAVYALPDSASGRAQLQAIASEIESAGASAFVCQANFPDVKTERQVVEAFNHECGERYRAWLGRARGDHTPSTERLTDLRARLDAIRERDRFEAPGAKKATARMVELERSRVSPAGPRRTAELVGRRWVTRKGVHVDRVACAWVVTRFIDPSARFRFVTSPDASLHRDEIGFDMAGAAITHADGRCSVESLVLRAGLGDRRLRHITEIVHDIDLRDDRFHHPETAGFEQLLLGTFTSHPRDEDRLEHGFVLFDALYAASGPHAPRVRMPSTPRMRIPPGLRRGRRP